MSYRASDIVFFFGAGTSAPYGIPTMKQFVVDFERFLNESGSEDEKVTYADIKETLEKQLNGQVDLEGIFTVIDGIINYSKERLGLLSLYSATGFRESFPSIFDKAVCKSLIQKFQSFVREKCLIPSESFDRISKVYRDFFNRLWQESIRQTAGYGSRGPYKYFNTWSMFTTNYDTCLEYYWREVARVPLNTGFGFDAARNTLVLDPRTFLELSRPNEMRLLKLHGSISWLVEQDGTVTEEKTVLGRSLVGREFVGELMIYPIAQKELYVNPYISMFVQLNRELKNKPIWVVIGYSFNDPVIREIFRKNSDETKIIVLLHPEAQKVREQRLMNVKCQRMSLLNQKFGEDDFTSVNYSLVKQLKTKPDISPVARL